MAHLEHDKQVVNTEQISDLERNGSIEKHETTELEHKQSLDSNDARINCFTPAEQRKIVHRVDRRLVSILGLLYMASLMDRTNLSAANIAGLAPIVLL